jgi:hypothetical protein
LGLHPVSTCPQTLPAPSGCLPNAPSALRDLIRALCNYSRYSEPFACLRLRFYDIGPAPCLCQLIDHARIATLAPRYTDGTPRAHPSSVQPSSVFRALRLLATSSLCLRHRISARFHPASLPDPCALVRSTVGPLMWLSETFRALCTLATDRLQPVASV